MADFEIKVGGDSKGAEQALAKVMVSLGDLKDVGENAVEMLTGRLGSLRSTLDSIRSAFKTLFGLVSKHPFAAVGAAAVAMGVAIVAAFRKAEAEAKAVFDGMEKRIRELKASIAELAWQRAETPEEKIIADARKASATGDGGRLKNMESRLEEKLARQEQARAAMVEEDQFYDRLNKGLKMSKSQKRAALLRDTRILQAGEGIERTKNTLHTVRGIGNDFREKQAEDRRRRIEDANSRHNAAAADLREMRLSPRQRLGSMRGELRGLELEGKRLDRHSPEYAENQAKRTELTRDIESLVREIRKSAVNKPAVGPERSKPEAESRSVVMPQAMLGSLRRRVSVADHFSHMRNVRAGRAPNEDILRIMHLMEAHLRRIAETEGGVIEA